MGNNPISGVDPDGGFVNTISQGWYNAMGATRYAKYLEVHHGGYNSRYKNPYEETKDKYQAELDRQIIASKYDRYDFKNNENRYSFGGVDLFRTSQFDRMQYLSSIGFTYGDQEMQKIIELSSLGDYRDKYGNDYKLSNEGALWVTSYTSFADQNSSSGITVEFQTFQVQIGNNGANQGGGATVYVEGDGIGHVYIEVNGSVFSYGRYDGSYSPSSGAFGPVGNGVLLKKSHSYAVERMAKNPTSVYSFPNANANAIYNYLNGAYNAGTPAVNGGMIIDTYFLIGNNCATTTCGALQVGGINIPMIQTPAGFNSYMHPVDWMKYEQYGPKY